MILNKETWVVLRGDTKSFEINLGGFSFDKIEEIRFTLKDSINTSTILEFIWPEDAGHAWEVIDGKLYLTLNHGDTENWRYTNYLFVPNSGSRRFFFDVQLRSKDPRRKFVTLCGNKLVLVADITNHDGNETISHFLETEAYSKHLVEGPALALLASWVNANNPSAKNPLLTLEDLKKVNAVASNVEIEMITLSEAQVASQKVALSKQPDEKNPIVVMFAGGIQTPVPESHYVVDGNEVSWNKEKTDGWLAGGLTKGFRLMLFYYSNALKRFG